MKRRSSIWYFNFNAIDNWLIIYRESESILSGTIKNNLIRIWFCDVKAQKPAEKWL